jgi:hypothetical protein
VIDRSTTRDIPHFPVALYEVALLFGTLVAETILASVHVRAHKQAGHMGASDLIKALQNTLQGGAVHIWEMDSPRYSSAWSRFRRGQAWKRFHNQSENDNAGGLLPLSRAISLPASASNGAQNVLPHILKVRVKAKLIRASCPRG